MQVPDAEAEGAAGQPGIPQGSVSRPESLFLQSLSIV